MLAGFGNVEIISGPLAQFSHTIGIDDSMFTKHVEITKTVNQETVYPGQNIDVTVKVSNKGSTSISNLVLDDRNASKGYVNGVEVKSGDLEMNLHNLPAGSSRELSYDIKVENPGQYYLSPARASYTMDDNVISYTSNRPHIKSERPEYLDHLSSLRRSTVLIFDLVTNGNGSLTLTLVDLIIVVILLYHGYRGYRDFVKGTLIADSL